MSTNAKSGNGGDGGYVRLPIIEQYAAIRARQRQIANVEHAVASVVQIAPSGSCAIWVRHAKRLWFLSWLLPPETAMLNPQPEAAMRFNTGEAAAALIEHVPALRDKARQDDAGIIDVGRRYRGVSLLRSSNELRMSATAAAEPVD